MPVWVVTVWCTLVAFAAWLLYTMHVLSEDQCLAMCAILIGIPFFITMLLE